MLQFTQLSAVQPDCLNCWRLTLHLGKSIKVIFVSYIDIVLWLGDESYHGASPENTVMLRKAAPLLVLGSPI